MRTRKTRKGGVLLYPKTEDIISEIVKFETGRITFFKQGTYGLLYKLTAKVPTSLKKIIPKKTVTPNSILVKIVPIDDDADVKINDEIETMDFVSLDKFEKEVHIHTEVVQRSIDIFECSITPTLLYAEVYTQDELMLHFRNIGEYVNAKGKIGLIFMENVIDDGKEGTSTLEDYHRINYKFVYDEIFPSIRRLLIMLGQLGILHNDYHLDNFLYSDGALYIIDFGLATRMTAKELDEFNGYVKKGDITNIIQFLFGTLEPHMTSETTLTLQYQWIRQNQNVTYLPGINAKVIIADQETITDPIHLEKEERSLCVIPKKINYVERDELQRDTERKIKEAAEKEQIRDTERKIKEAAEKEQIRNKKIVLHQTTFSNNKELVLEFVKADGLSLQYASPELQQDKEVVMNAVRQNGYALQYTPLKDMDVIMTAIRQTYLAFQLVSPELKANKEFVKNVLFLDGRCYNDIDERLKDDPEMMAYARYSEIPFLFRFNKGVQEQINDFLEWTPVKKGKQKSDTFKIIMKRHRENYPLSLPSIGGKTRRNRKTKGGVLFLKSQDILSELRKFATGTITLVNSGKSGITFKLTAENDFDIHRMVVKDPTQISSILVKLVSIGEDLTISGRTIEGVMIEEFENEVNTHHDICERSLKQFHCSIAPSLLHADIYKSDDLKKQFPNIGKYIPFQGDFGLIFMELILSPYGNNAFTLKQYYSYPETKEWAVQEFPKARRLLIMLAQLGFLHNDFHLNNIVCSPPALFLIDFGYVTPFSRHTELKRYLDEKDYVNLIPLLYGKRKVELNTEVEIEYALNYQWLRQHQKDTFVSGLDPTIDIASEEEITGPIHLTTEEIAKCVKPSKKSYLATRKSVDSREKSNQDDAANSYLPTYGP